MLQTLTLPQHFRKKLIRVFCCVVFVWVFLGRGGSHNQALELPEELNQRFPGKLRHFCCKLQTWNFCYQTPNITERQFPKDPLVCPKKGIVSTIRILWPVDGIYRPLGRGLDSSGLFFFPGVPRCTDSSCQATHLHATFQLPIYGVLVLDDPMKLGAELVSLWLSAIYIKCQAI